MNNKNSYILKSGATNVKRVKINVIDIPLYIGEYSVTVDPVYVAPLAQTLSYNGSQQNLLIAGSTLDGVIQYSSDGENWWFEMGYNKYWSF